MKPRAILRIAVPILLVFLLIRALVTNDNVGVVELVASGIIIAALLALAVRGAVRRA
jgi:hypothetical protein